MRWTTINTAQSWTIGLFLLALTVPLYFIFHFARGFYINIEIDPASVTDLTGIYQKHGLTAYFDAKKNLQERIEKVLSHPPNERAELAAANIALYLFPQVLPQSNFEKEVALELWAPLEKQIENAPKTKESRKAFEELRANIWNYENPDRNSPALSRYAKEALHLFNEMSSP